MYSQGVLHPSSAETATGSGPDTVIHESGPVAFYLDVTAGSGTTPTLDARVQEKDPVGGKYFDIATFALKTGVATERLLVAALAGKTLRAAWTIGGATPSFTFSLGFASKGQP